jgi:hypothetical protein
MARPKDLNLAHAWRQRLQRHVVSGLSIPEFCARGGDGVRRITINPVSLLIGPGESLQTVSSGTRSHEDRSDVSL